MLRESVINKLTLARHLFHLAEASIRSHRDAALFASVNLMQDAVEAFLLAAADHVNASIDQNTKFDAYFSQINAKVAPRELPFRARLLQLNRLRINAKHYAIRPDQNEVRGFTVACREFFTEVAETILGVKFWSVSLVDLLEDGEVNTLKGGYRCIR